MALTMRRWFTVALTLLVMVGSAFASTAELSDRAPAVVVASSSCAPQPLPGTPDAVPSIEPASDETSVTAGDDAVCESAAEAHIVVAVATRVAHWRYDGVETMPGRQRGPPAAHPGSESAGATWH